MDAETSRSDRDEDPRVEGTILRTLKRRILASIGIGTAVSVLLLLYVGFLAERYPWYANVAVVLSGFVVLTAALAALWVAWGISLARHFGARFDGPDG
ncbi:MAG TPA: hypothetical protein VLY85_03545 [Thermoplasmata archaeon]|nr:hypothetical protein [Thermoplasmata archaeon]